MSQFHAKAYLAAALALTLMAGSAQAQPGSFEERRLLMRQMTEQLQARLEQRLRCINQAKSWGDLNTCQRANSTGWHHGPGMGGPGMGGWGCPMW
jgi:hypothetical protein